jgi:hypothetical protein
MTETSDNQPIVAIVSGLPDGHWADTIMWTIAMTTEPAVSTVPDHLKMAPQVEASPGICIEVALDVLESCGG